MLTGSHLRKLTRFYRQHSSLHQQLYRELSIGVQAFQKNLENYRADPNEYKKLYMDKYQEQDPLQSQTGQGSTDSTSIQQSQGQQPNLYSSQIQVEKIWNVFNMLKQSEVEPTDPIAIQYTSEMMRQFKQQKQADSRPVTVRTFQKERTPDGGVEPNSRPLVNFDEVQFPETNIVPLTSMSDGQQVNLASYRYPSVSAKRKGIIYYIHGYGDYTKRYAYFAKHFAFHRYDFVGFDMKGFGFSGGKRGEIKSQDDLVQDQLRFMELIQERFGGQDTPQFLLGMSLGGRVALKTVEHLQDKSKIRGVGLLAPYIKSQSMTNIQFKAHISQVIETMYPNMLTERQLSDLQQQRRQQKIKDVINNFVDMFHQLDAQISQTDPSFQQIQTNTMMILGGKDQIIDNEEAADLYHNGISNEVRKSLITYDDLDHLLIQGAAVEGHPNYQEIIAKDLIGFFDSLL